MHVPSNTAYRRAMARALFATALTQAVVGAIALTLPNTRQLRADRDPAWRARGALCGGI